MKYVLLDGICCLAKRGAVPLRGSLLTLQFPQKGSLLLNEKDRFDTEDGVLHIPVSALRAGENVLCFRTEGKTLRTEGLLRRQNTLSPCGIAKEDLIFALIGEHEKLQARLVRLEADIAEYAKKTLFA